MADDKGRLCPVTGMTYKEREALRLSWKALTGKTAKSFKAAGLNMLLWMFDHVPGVRDQFSASFPKSEKNNMSGDEMFLAHVQSVMLALDALVKNIDNEKLTRKKLLSLAKVHLKQGPPVGTDYFQPFADNYHLYVELSLKLPPRDHAINAWHKLFATMNDYIAGESIRSVQESQERLKKSKRCTVL